ncbi:Uncharacterized protein F383_24982 [Gossypium arboreum]|uniref:Uncharacterized protein n=1 Tax=Gossypium arboreum TaxID=29729 RepID=A0A0B0PB12_GOSAR|nr:Uncharacterized protein F383_24982 [Gossypium arboreum]
MRASVRHVWDMHRPQDVSQCQTCLRHASATRCASVRHVWDMHRHAYMCQCKTCLGHSIDTDGRELVQDHSWTMASSKRCTQNLRHSPI